MACNVKKFFISVFLLIVWSFFGDQYINAMRLETAPVQPTPPVSVDYGDFFRAPGPFARYYPPEDINQKVRDFFNSKGITVELFKSKSQVVICPIFDVSKFDVKKCKKPEDRSVIAFFPSQPDGPQELENFVFKTPFDGSGQANFKRVFYAQSINAHLQSRGVTSMRAPQKYLVLLPDGDIEGAVDENYKVISEKISIAQNKGNPFDLMTAEDLRILLYDVVFRFGLCDLHVDSTDRNIVYDDHGTMIFIDTESYAEMMSTWVIQDSFNARYFFKEKKVLPEEHFIAQKLLLRETRGTNGYNLGRTLARWIHILNMGLIYPYRYYNFDTVVPPPQKDTLRHNQGRDFSEAAFAEHRRVICEGIYTVMNYIKLCTQEIERVFPNIRVDSLAPFGLFDFGPELGGDRHHVNDEGTRFAIVPIEEYLTRTTKRNAGPMRVYRYDVHGQGAWHNEDRIAVPGRVFADLEREFQSPGPAPTPSVTKKISPPTKAPSPADLMNPPIRRLRRRKSSPVTPPAVTLPVLGPSDVQPTDVQPTDVQPIKLSNLQGALLNLRERLIKLNEKLMQLKRAH